MWSQYFFLGLTKSALFRYTTICLFIRQWPFRLFPHFDYCEKCCYKQAGTCISGLVFSPFEFIPGSRNRIRRRRWHPTPVLLPGKSHGWRSLVGCSPWGCEESDMTERLHFHFPLSYIGEGNGNPLQCQSQTRLKWLSRNRIARSYGNSIFNFLRNQQNVFQGSWTTLRSQQSTWQFWNAVSSAFQDILLSMVPHSVYIHVYTYIYIYIYKGEWKSLSHGWLFETPWAVAHQAPLSMEFSRQEYRSGWLFPSPGDLPNPGIEPRPPTLQVDSLPSESPGNPLYMATSYIFFSSNFSSCFLLEVFFRFLSWLSSGFYQPQQSHPTWWL